MLNSLVSVTQIFMESLKSRALEYHIICALGLINVAENHVFLKYK